MSNPQVTASQLFYNKLNEANPQLPHPLTPTNVSVGVPTVNGNGGVAKNSVISVTANPGFEYSGTVQQVYYDRVSMVEILATAPTANVFPYTNQSKISDVLASFNAIFTVNLVPSDIIDGPLPSADPTTGQISFTLAAAATSLAFKDSIQLIYKPNDISLTTFPTMILTGLAVADVKQAGLTATQMLLKRINADNASVGRFLSAANCTVSTANALTGDASGKDTSVTVTGTAGSGFHDQAVFYYNRVGLQAIIDASAAPTNVVPNTGQITLADMVASFNATYGAFLNVADVQAATPASLGGGYVGVTLTPVVGHPTYNAGAQIKFLQSYPTLTLTGSFNGTAGLASAYTSNIAISGGSGHYQNARLNSGTLPPGLALSVSGTNLVLSGTGSTAGTYMFTASVDSDDGQTVTSVTQTVTVAGQLDQLVSNPILTGLTISDVTS